MRTTRVICVSGGKGGVGKTMVSVNLAIALSRQGRKVLLFDADLGLANVDVALGLQAENNLRDVLDGHCELTDAIVPVTPLFDVLPAATADRELSQLSTEQNIGIIRSFSQMLGHYDVLLIDTAAGINDSVLDFAKAAQEMIVVACNEPTSIADAYALIKTMHQAQAQTNIHVIANMVETAEEGRLLFSKLTRVSERFLDRQLDYMGSIKNDIYVKKSIQKRQALLDSYPGSPAALAILQLAKQADSWSMPLTASGRIEFFLEQLLGTDIDCVEIHP